MLFLQSVLVVGSGAVLGVLLAWAALPWIRRLQINPQLTYFMQRIELDATVLIVSIAIAGIAAVVAGVLPAWFNRNIDLVDGLRSGARGASLSPAAMCR